MNVGQMLAVIQQQSGRQATPEQIAVVQHGSGPLWVIAGPGSGKTEVLVLRCLKLACVDLVPPRSIILTTFTEKAARNLQDRLATYKSYLDQADPALRSVDVFQIRIGTLHGLCNDIMQEYRYPGYQNYRLLDEIDQLLFVREHCPPAASTPPAQFQLPFWQAFSYLVSRYSAVTGYRWTPTSAFVPHRWLRANAIKQLYDRVAEDYVDVQAMRNQGGVWQALADGYDAYKSSLDAFNCVDFAHLQSKFLDFLASAVGRQFLAGNGSAEHPGVGHVLVDEYQDTNRIQEEIYLRLASQAPHNLCVVGDDDQALYRFRGGTVECMVTFDQACARAWGQGIQVTQQPLSRNYRSHPSVVQWCDDYIQSFSVMTRPGARVPSKPSLNADPQWFARRGLQAGGGAPTYPSVCYLVGQRDADVAGRFADTVQGLLASGVIQDVSQCVLLAKSTQTTPRNVGPYVAALLARGIDVYNPRARTFLQQDEVEAALGALVTVLDPSGQALQQVRATGITNMINAWRVAYQRLAPTYGALAGYVTAATAHIAGLAANQTVTQVGQQGVTTFPATIQEILYHIIAHEPFLTWQSDPERTLRLARLSKLLESYCSLPFAAGQAPSRGILRTDPQQGGALNQLQLGHFYQSLVGLLVSEGLRDPEDDEVICPPGKFPVMTVHQAKGLEWPFVFVVKPGVTAASVGAELALEDDLRPFRRNQGANLFTAQERADQDTCRFFYVAYSRAEYALVILSNARELRDAGMGFGGYGRTWFLQRAQPV